jgi:hypothetical protein
MEKKESPKKYSSKKENNIPPRISGLSDKAFGIIKFILGICLLSFVYSSTVSFLNEFGHIEKPLQNTFWGGVITFLFVYLLVWEPTVVYAKGQEILEAVFSFFKPLVKVAPYLLPIYTLLLLAAFGILSVFNKSYGLLKNFIFLFGFSVALHLVFGAKTLRSKHDFLKANYIFGFSLVYILNLALLALCFSAIFKEFFFVSFCNLALDTSGKIFYTVFGQLFLNR